MAPIEAGAEYSTVLVTFLEKKMRYVQPTPPKLPSLWPSASAWFGGMSSEAMKQHGLISVLAQSTMFMTWRRSWGHLFNNDPDVGDTHIWDGKIIENRHGAMNR